MRNQIKIHGFEIGLMLYKRPFLLLEILIAFLLVALCAVPLVSQPLKLYRAEIQSLERLERERLADWTFSEIKELFLKNEIPWNKIPSKGEQSGPFPLPKAQIDIPGCSPKSIERSFTLQCKGEKEGIRNEPYRLLWVDIQFSPPLSKPARYTFRMTVQKIS